MGIGYVHVSMDINRVQGSLERLEKKYQAYGITLVSGLAAEARQIAYRNYFHRTRGTLRYNSPDRPNYPEHRHREPLKTKRRQGYVDSRGYRLISFSLEAKSPSHKGAYLSSYPMNLWERPTKNGRPGKFIVTVKLPPLVEAIVPKHIAKAEEKLAEIANATMGGTA